MRLRPAYVATSKSPVNVDIIVILHPGVSPGLPTAPNSSIGGYRHRILRWFHDPPPPTFIPQVHRGWDQRVGLYACVENGDFTYTRHGPRGKLYDGAGRSILIRGLRSGESVHTSSRLREVVSEPADSSSHLDDRLGDFKMSLLSLTFFNNNLQPLFIGVTMLQYVIRF